MRAVLFSAIILLLLGTVAVEAQYYAGYIGNDGYSGYDARERRLTDPYSRDRYFGQDYVNPFLNFGSKGPMDRLLSTGAKSAYSGVFNLDTNSFSPQGRNPNKISNWDPNFRGYARQDVVVKLEPFSVMDANSMPLAGKGTARIISHGQEKLNQNDYSDFTTQVFVQTINLEPVTGLEMYEVWLFDDETEYALSLGVLRSSLKLTQQLITDIPKSLLAFDAVMITKEPFLDSDPRPGEIVLYGEIPQSRAYVPVSTSYIPQRLR